MKSLLLTAATIALSVSLQAQVFELGLKAGVSTAAKPHNSLYQGSENVYNYAAGLDFHYSFSERWQIGVDVMATKWQRGDKWPLTNTNNTKLGEQDVRIVLAQSAVSFALQFNHVVPFYQPYEDFVRSALYFGVSGGAVVVGNDGKVNYGRVNPNTPAEYTYASQYNFESGYGVLVGFQLGYAYYFSSRFGFNVEVAPKVAWVKTHDARLGRANNEYNIFYVPATIGLRYRFGFDR